MTTTYELHISAPVDGEERILFGGRIHYSREDAEREADKIGLELAARAGYNPLAAVSLWRKMDELKEVEPPEILSTHPSNENRIEDIQKHSEKIMHLYEENKIRFN